MRWSFLKDGQASEGLLCPPSEEWWGGEKIYISCWRKSRIKEKRKAREDTQMILVEFKRHLRNWRWTEWRQSDRKRKKKSPKRNRREEREYSGEVYLNTLCAVGRLNLTVLMVIISHRGLQRRLVLPQAAKWSWQKTNNELWMKLYTVRGHGDNKRAHTDIYSRSWHAQVSWHRLFRR